MLILTLTSVAVRKGKPCTGYVVGVIMQNNPIVTAGTLDYYIK